MSSEGGSVCDASHRGELRFEQDYSGTEDVLWACMSSSAGSYNWVMVARGG